MKSPEEKQKPSLFRRMILGIIEAHTGPNLEVFDRAEAYFPETRKQVKETTQ